MHRCSNGRELLGTPHLERERGRNHTGLGPSKRTRGELLKPRDTFGDFPLGSAFPSRGMTSTGRVSPGFTDVGSINEPPSTPVSNIGWLRSLCPARESASLEQTLAQNERAPHPERPVRCARADGTSLRTSCRFCSKTSCRPAANTLLDWQGPWGVRVYFAGSCACFPQTCRLLPIRAARLFH